MGNQYQGVQAVAPLADYRLLLTFDNGERRQFDVKPYLAQGIFAALKDPAIFNSVRVGFDTIQWNNGADLCPEVLYAESQPLESDQLPVRESPSAT
jgi:hypothetical protein